MSSSTKELNELIATTAERLLLVQEDFVDEPAAFREGQCREVLRRNMRQLPGMEDPQVFIVRLQALMPEWGFEFKATDPNNVQVRLPGAGGAVVAAAPPTPQVAPQAATVPSVVGGVVSVVPAEAPKASPKPAVPVSVPVPTVSAVPVAPAVSAGNAAASATIRQEPQVGKVVPVAAPKVAPAASSVPVVAVVPQQVSAKIAPAAAAAPATSAPVAAAKVVAAPAAVKPVAAALLAASGPASSAGTADALGVFADLPKKLKSELQITCKVDPARALEALVLLGKLASNLDRIEWDTWHQLAPDAKRQRPMFRQALASYLEGKDSPGAGFESMIAELQELTVALTTAVAHAGAQFAQMHQRTFSPEMIEAAAKEESGGGAIAARCWKKYVQLAEGLNEERINTEISGKVKEFVNEVLGRKS